MKRPTDSRTLWMAAGVAAVAAAAGPAAAQSQEIRGAVTFEGGTVIPQGQLKIYLEDRSIRDEARRRAAITRIQSDGKSTTLAFSLSAPATLPPSPTLQIVARLERADGWLLARGSTPFESGPPVSVKLNAATY
ncbi:hypothetical protein HPT29_023255 [Microvirga terrae]|uniref:Uncharacterized protein n=1 Tax=Microvirga terrae TaxID=2740529 RepID=A0ABY5RPX9_9HYPH|nr:MULTISPECIES: hypothetical protein [Microvirga]MBQ0824509.1 hypothetical protein [Microvirga sp. HBU67558]UVF19310.1 hypothetical protein HPT29_023255 [Microvirga terrae]